MSKRPILSLPSVTSLPNDTEENREIILATYDVLLPCRRFNISYKVAVLGRVSLTAEFLLRLLKSSDGIEEGDAAYFFGFDRRDMSFVLSEVESSGYVERKDGKLWLTIAGQNLFRVDSDVPEIFEVEKVRESVGFDLIALAPERYQWIEDYMFGLPELKISDNGQVSDASARVPAAFRRFYTEIMTAKGKNNSFGNKRSIYSVDQVDAGERFLVPVTIAVKSLSATPWMGEADLSEWRSDQELQDRTKIGDSASAFVQGLLVSRRATDSDAYRFLSDIGAEFLKEFTRSDGLAVDRYYREVLARRGKLQVNRPTIPVLGALTNKDNIERLIDAMSYASKRTARPSRFVWIKPQMSFWGATRILPETIRRLKTMIPQHNDDQEAKSVCLVTGKPENYLIKMFDQVYESDQPRFPAALEVLLVPGFVAAVIVHAPVKVVSGHAVPLGLLSFDPLVVERVQGFILEELPNYKFDDYRQFDECRIALSMPFPP